MMEMTATADDPRATAPPRWLLVAALLLPMLFNAIALLPELRSSTLSDNDQVFHYVFIARANQAIDGGDSPFDHWVPELELGFPEFLYYQNLPHLAVVALYRLLGRHLSLLRALNLVRYLLMVSFPLTVYWSIRRMEFSAVAAAVAATFCSTLSSQVPLGLDYRSYVWEGFGMYPQLCAMHLMFIAVASLQSVLRRAKCFPTAIVASAALVLSDLLYGCIFAVLALLLLALRIWEVLRAADGKSEIGKMLARLAARFALVATVAFLIAAYQIVPFLQGMRYVSSAVPEVPVPLAHGGIRTSAILFGLFDGGEFDHYRLPVLTFLILLGIVYSLSRRQGGAPLAIAIFVISETLAFGRVFFGSAIELIPLARDLPLIRFAAGVDFAAILLIGLGAELLWRWLAQHWSRYAMAAFAIGIGFIAIVAFQERWSFYERSGREMAETAQALVADSGLREIFAKLKTLPPGRVYAGKHSNWGTWLAIGRLHVFDLLPVEQFDTVMPWQSLSLNSSVLWKINIPDAALCNLFNIRYVIAPPALRVPPSYKEVLNTSQYVLYAIETGGYAELGRVAKLVTFPPRDRLADINQVWMTGSDPVDGRFIAFSTGRSSAELLQVNPGSSDSGELGSIVIEVLTPDSYSSNVSVTAPSSALMVIKITYHPNWHLSIDGREQPTFMVSPSYIGTMLSPGHHLISAEYRTSKPKTKLLVVSSLILLVTFISQYLAGLGSWLESYNK